VVTVGSIHGGEAMNVIHEEVRMNGTFRSLSNDDLLRVKRRIEEIATGVATANQCEASLSYPIPEFPPTINAESAWGEIEPGGPDQGQPTHFIPRRNRFLVRIVIPRGFDKKELMWTLTTRGKTERAYATLKRDYFIDDIVIMNNSGAGGAGGGRPDTIGNKSPVLKVDGEKSQVAKIGQAVPLTAFASDDGKPRPRAMPMPLTEAARAARGTPNSATGLRLSWFVYRGAGKVTFDPSQIEVREDYRDGTNSPWSAGWRTPATPPDGKWVSRVTFSEPGTYVLRCLAHDGGLMTSEDVTFVVSR